MHKVAPDIEATLDTPLLHIVDAVAAGITAGGANTVALLGTAYTMEDSSHRVRRAQAGIEALVPGPSELARIQEIIYSELVRGSLSERSRTWMLTITSQLVEVGPRVFASCTEIELLVKLEDVTIPYFPTTALPEDFAACWVLT
jgi:aspartate racemase